MTDMVLLSLVSAFLGDRILEEIACNESSDDGALVRQFISAAKYRTLKPEAITVDSAVKGLCFKLAKSLLLFFAILLFRVFFFLFKQLV